MVINHLLNGMILQVIHYTNHFKNERWNRVLTEQSLRITSFNSTNPLFCRDHSYSYLCWLTCEISSTCQFHQPRVSSFNHKRNDSYLQKKIHILLLKSDIDLFNMLSKNSQKMKKKKSSKMDLTPFKSTGKTNSTTLLGGSSQDGRK